MSITADAVAVSSPKGLKYESSQELEELDEHGVIDPHVPSRYRGTVTDKRDMQTLGKVQVLRVSADRACAVDRRSVWNALLYLST